MAKNCNNCPYIYFCWDEWSTWCYRDNEDILGKNLEINGK